MWIGPAYDAADTLLGGLALSEILLIGYVFGIITWVAAFLISYNNESQTGGHHPPMK